MKALRQLIFIFVAIIGLSLAISAQKNGPKKPPPKEKPPVINPGDKKPPRDNPPRDGKKGKKPGMALMFVANRTEIDTA